MLEGATGGQLLPMAAEIGMVEVEANKVFIGFERCLVCTQRRQASSQTLAFDLKI